MRMLIARTGRNPFEIWILCGCVISGVAGLLQPGSASRAAARLLPAWELYIWYGGLLVTGTTALVAVLFLRTNIGLALERGALITLAGLAVVYAVVVVSAGGGPFALSALITASVSVACLVRAWHITADLRRAETAEIERGSP